MRPNLLLPALVLAGLGAAAALPATGSADHDRCPHGGTTIVKNDQARVWKVRPPSGIDRHYGCARRVGRVVRLDPRGGQAIGFRGKVRLAGTTVLYETSYADPRPFRVVSRSLRSGRIFHRATSNARGSADGHSGPMVRPLLKRNGSMAWTASVDCVCEGVDHSVAGWEVHAFGRDGRRVVLDRGPEVRPDSLRFRDGGRRIEWVHGSEVRTAELR